MSGVSEIASYNGVLLAGEKPELLPPNLPFLQSLHVGVPKKLFVDGLQFLPDLINQSLSIDHGNLSVAVGPPLRAAPRTDPYVRDYLIRLLPRVHVTASRSLGYGCRKPHPPIPSCSLSYTPQPL